MFKKAVVFLSLCVVSEAARKNIKDKQRKNAVPEEILKAERALRMGMSKSKSDNGKNQSKSGKGSSETIEEIIDDETLCGIVSLAISDIATAATRIQCNSLSPALVTTICPDQEDLCSADFSLTDFCPEDCESACEQFLMGSFSAPGCCPETRCCTGSDLSPDTVCAVYAAANTAFTAGNQCSEDLEREFCPCTGTTAMAYCSAVAPACSATCMTFVGNCCGP